jgi:hypothetical protein
VKGARTAQICRAALISARRTSATAARGAAAARFPLCLRSGPGPVAAPSFLATRGRHPAPIRTSAAGAAGTTARAPTVPSARRRRSAACDAPVQSWARRLLRETVVTLSQLRQQVSCDNRSSRRRSASCHCPVALALFKGNNKEVYCKTRSSRFQLC